MASAMGKLLPCTGSGTYLATLSASAKGMAMARAMSRTPERALIWCMVTICPTFDLPYFSVTYLMTSPRRFMQKSMSKSGMLTRSGLRKRSNSSLLAMGSMSVMRSA